MRNIRSWSIMLVTSYILFACSSNSSTSAGNDGTSNATSDNSGGGSSKGDASFSCKIDGKDFSGKGTDNSGNAAFVTTPGIINFVLMPIVADQHGIPAQFAFHVADKGATAIHGTDNPNYSVHYAPANTLDNDYQCKEMTVTITSSETSRVRGTFSGTLIEPKTDREVPVTDGKFDIPYSSYSKK